jgi:hypothetical protein
MRRVVGHLVDNPPFEKFHPVLGGKDTRFNHSLILIDRKLINEVGQNGTFRGKGW